MVSGRLMNTTLASPSTSWSGTSTAADTLPGTIASGAAPGGDRSKRRRTSSSESRRADGSSPSHGGGPARR
jgi:hypothetical protein